MKFPFLVSSLGIACLTSSLFALSCTEIQILSDPAVDAAYSKVAINSSGEAVVCWKLIDSFAVKGLQVVAKEEGGSWSFPETIEEGRGDIEDFQCSVDAAGNKFVAWSLESEGSDVMQLKMVEKKRGNEWSFTQEIVTAAERCFFLEYGFSQPENLEAVGRSYFSKYSLNHWSKPAFEAKKISSIYSDYNYPNLSAFGVNGEGGAYALVKKYNDHFSGYRLDNGSFIEEKFPFEAWDEDGGQTVVDRKGNVTLLMTADDESLLAVSQVDKKWEEVSVLERESGDITYTEIASDDQGNLFAVWQYDLEEEGCFLKAAYKPYGEKWQIFEDIRGEGHFCGPLALSSNNQGSFVILFQKLERGQFSVHGASFNTAAHSFSEIQQLSGKRKMCIGPSLAFTKEGKGLVTWTNITNSLELSVEVADLRD